MKIRRIFRRVLLPLFLVGIGIAAVFFWALPRFLESGTLRNKLPVGPAAWEIRRAGPNGLDAADLRLGPEDQPTLTAGALRVDYGAASLLGGRIAAVQLSGVQLFLEWRDGRLLPRSWDQLRLPEPAPETSPPSESAPPVSVGSIRVDTGLLHLNSPAGHFLLPFSGVLIPESDDFRTFSAELTLRPRGETAVLSIRLDRNGQTLSAQLESNAVDLARFADLARAPGLVPAGRLDLSARLGMNVETLRPTGGRLRLSLDGDGPAWREWELAGDDGFRLEMESEDGETWHATQLSAALAAPVPLKLTGDALQIQWSEDRIALDGAVTLGLESTGGNGAESPSALQAEKQFQWPMTVSGELSQGKWTAEAKISPPEKKTSESDAWAIQIGTTGISGERPQLHFTGNGDPSQGIVETGLSIPEFFLDFGGIPLQFGAFNANANVQFGAEGIQIQGTASGKTARLEAGETRIAVPTLSMKVNATPEAYAGNLSFSGGSLRAGDFRMDGVSGKLPMSWPWAAADSDGKLSAETLHFDERAIGSISGSIRQTETGIGFQLRHASRLIPGAAVDLDGETRFFGTPHHTAVTFETRHAIDPPLDIGRFAPAAQGMTLSGNLHLSGQAVVDAAGFRCPAEISLEEGHWKLDDPLAEAKGIQLFLPMDDLASVRGRPGGRMQVDSLTFGAFQFEAMDVRLQVESTPALLVERAGFNWCGGNVDAQAFRLAPAQTEFDLLLYADRIHLARFLDQLGAGRAEGEGTVSGRIPVKFRDGGFRFSDGVLFSMPGRGGTLHVTGTDTLASMVGQGTPQGAQLDLALAALESFAYDWARLRLNSEGDALSLALEFNGRPTEPLPFVYKESVGGFVRTDPEAQVKSRFQGIQLNLNLDLPLDDLLRYRGIFDMIQSGG
jgi:hypothetical protein